MSDLFGIGSSALLAYRQALDVTGHNIANANTAGYVRQRVELLARPGQSGGVSASTITRYSDQILNTRLLGDNAAYSRLDAFSTLATRLDGLLSDADAGLAKPLQEFFTALNGLATNPTSLASRQVVLAKAETLAARFADIHGQLEAQSSEINQRLTQSVAEINNYASSVAKLNDRIALAAAGGQPPNDLLDQRDQLVNEISNRVGISTVKQSDGTLNLYLGSGQALVLGTQSYTLGTAADRYNSGGLDITYGTVRLTSQLSGGSIGGLLDYRREMLNPAFNQLGRLAAGLSESVNAQHALGMDANGLPGADFFQSIGSSGIASVSNSGSAAVDMTFADVAQLGSEDYVLSFGGSWTLSSRSTGQSIALGGSGTVADPFTAAGLSITVSGAAVAGDQFLLRPTRDAGAQLQLVLTDPQQLAAAAMPPGGPVVNSGDNSNARALAALASFGVLNGGQTSISAGYTALVTRVGTQTQGAQLSRDAAAAIHTQTLTERDSLSGVNLDEEAADLLRWQQAYQAAAQLIATANTLFDSLLNATRR